MMGIQKATLLEKRKKTWKADKLVLNRKDQKIYVVRIKNLNQTLKHGLKLDKVHWLIRFEQSYWIKSYITLNNKLRTVAKNEFEKDFWTTYELRLMKNRIFGKAVENIRNYKKMKLVTSREKYDKYGIRPKMDIHFRQNCLL